MNYVVEKHCVFMEGLMDEGYKRNIRHDLCPQNPIQGFLSRI